MKEDSAESETEKITEGLEIVEKPIQETVPLITVDLPERAPESEFEKNVRLAREQAIARLPRSNSLGEFMTLTNAVRGLDASELGTWVEDEYRGMAPDEWLANFMEDSGQVRYEQEAKYVDVLQKEVGDELPDKIKVGVMKIIEEGIAGPRAAYRSLAVFPHDKQVDSYDVPRVLSQSTNDRVYMDFTAACNFQAADVILEGKDVVTFEIDNLPIGDLHDLLGFDLSQGSKQNFKHRDAEGNTIGHRDQQLYLLYAIKGGFTNESRRYLVSDFKAKQPTSESVI